MAQAKQGDTVKVHYTGKFPDGTVFDSSEGANPLEFTIGNGQVIPGFDNGVIGMAPAESRTIDIPAVQAYGAHQDEMVVVLERDKLPSDLNPDIGDQLQMKGMDGRLVVVEVTAIDEATLTLDANHPLAGKDLTFDINLVEIK